MTELKQGMYADRSDKTVKDLIWLFFGASDQTWGFKLEETAVCDGGGGAASSTMRKKWRVACGGLLQPQRSGWGLAEVVVSSALGVDSVCEKIRRTKTRRRLPLRSRLIELRATLM